MTHADDDPPDDSRPVPAAAVLNKSKVGRPSSPVRSDGLTKLLRRLAALPDGRYQIVITVDQGGPVDWTVLFIGKVEGGRSGVVIKELP